MAVQDEVRSPVVQGLPQGPHRSVFQGAGAEQRMMEVGERAADWVRREIGAQPLLLGGACGVGEVAVQGDEGPVAEVGAVVTLERIARRRARVRELGRGPWVLYRWLPGTGPGRAF